MRVFSWRRILGLLTDSNVFAYPLGKVVQVVITAHGVEAGGGASRSTLLLQCQQLFLLESGFPYTTPVVIIPNHVKAGRKCPVGSYKGPILTGAAVLGLHATPHSVLEGLEMLDGIDHGPTLPLSIDEPLQEVVHLIVSIRGDVQSVVFMFVMIHVDEAVGWFVKVVIRPHMVLASDLRQQLHVFDIGFADVDIEKEQITVFFLPFNQVSKLRLNTHEGLWQAFARGYAVNSQIYGGYTCSPHFVYKFLVHEIPVGGKIHEEFVFRAITDNLENKTLAHQRFPTHEGDDTATHRLEPVNGALGRFQVHAWFAVVILETVVAIYVTAPLRIEVAKDGSELPGMNAGVNVRDRPASNSSEAIKALVTDSFKHDISSFNVFIQPLLCAFQEAGGMPPIHSLTECYHFKIVRYGHIV